MVRRYVGSLRAPSRASTTHSEVLVSGMISQRDATIITRDLGIL